jgi:NodT family efflux transporter outer membrane factor (OMF) lipoprotein
MKRATRLEIVEVLPVLRGLGLLLLSCLTLVACTVGPDYETPELEQEVPDAWKSAAAEEVEGDGSPLATWWTTLNDPKLVELIGEARQSNLSVQIAAARVEAARARLGVATGRYYPDVIVDASYSRNRPSENSAQFVPPEGFEDFSLYNIGVGFDWEIDVFGRLRRGAESARAGLEASIEDYRDVMVILMADVAANYVDVRTFQDRIKYLQANVEAQSESLQLTQDRFDAGLSPLTDVTQAEYNLANSQAGVPTLEAGLAAAVNRLAVLLGKPPGAVDDLLATDPGIPDPDDTVALGIPAELLRRRPDIRAAERRLASQTARIGVAKADLYPTFSLAGILTLESFTSSNLFESESTGWSLVPGVRWNIFSGGRIRSQVQVQEALTQAREHDGRLRAPEGASRATAGGGGRQRADRGPDPHPIPFRSDRFFESPRCAADTRHPAGCLRRVRGSGGSEPDRAEPGPRWWLGAARAGDYAQRERRGDHLHYR